MLSGSDVPRAAPLTNVARITVLSEVDTGSRRSGKRRKYFAVQPLIFTPEYISQRRRERWLRLQYLSLGAFSTTAIVALDGYRALWGHAGWMFAAFVLFGLLKRREEG